jgi:hypothetical protein
LPWRITRLPDGGCSFGGRILRVGESVEVVPVEQLDEILSGLREARQKLSRYEDKGVKQVGRTMLTLERAVSDIGAMRLPNE